MVSVQTLTKPVLNQFQEEENMNYSGKTENRTAVSAYVEYGISIFFFFFLLSIFVFSPVTSQGSDLPDWATERDYYTDKNPYYPTFGGQCTSYVWGRVYEVHDIWLAFKGDRGLYPRARYWIEGGGPIDELNLTTGNSPRSNSIAVWGGDAINSFGHVAYIEEVSETDIFFSEANYDTYGRGSHTLYGGGVDNNGERKELSLTEFENRVGAGEVIGYIYLSPIVTIELNTPADQTSNVEIPVQFGWNSTGMNHHRILVSTSRDNWTRENGWCTNEQCTQVHSSIRVNQATGDSKTYSWTNAELGTTYWWSVRGHNDAVPFTTNYTEPFKFTTYTDLSNQPFPDTGQTKCYDNFGEIPCPQPGQPFYGQDAQYQPRLPQSYTKLGYGGVVLEDSAAHVDDGGPWIMTRDNVTGLIWEIKTEANKGDRYTWQNAQDVFVAGLKSARFGGFSDWRLPSRQELASLVNRGVWNPSIDVLWFPKTQSSGYWSATTDAYLTNFAWLVHFYNGIVYFHDKSHSYYVRAVRAG